MTWCRNRPDEALYKLSKLKSWPQMSQSHTASFFRFVAIGQKTLLAYESNGNVVDPRVQSLSEECFAAISPSS